KSHALLKLATPLRALAISPDRTLAIVAGEDGTLVPFDPSSGKARRPVPVPFEVRALRFLTDKKVVAAGIGGVGIWDLAPDSPVSVAVRVANSTFGDITAVAVESPTSFLFSEEQGQIFRGHDSGSAELLFEVPSDQRHEIADLALST